MIDLEIGCPRCLADPGQPCFIGDGPSELVHLTRRELRNCLEAGHDADTVKAAVEKSLRFEQQAETMRGISGSMVIRRRSRE